MAYVLLLLEHALVIGIFFFTVNYINRSIEQNARVYTIVKNVSELIQLADEINEINQNRVFNQWDVLLSHVRENLYHIDNNDNKTERIILDILVDIQRADDIIKSFSKKHIKSYGKTYTNKNNINNINVILKNVSTSCDILLDASLQKVDQVEKWCESTIVLVVVFFACSLVWAFWFIEKNIVFPLNLLAAKTKQIGQGDFDLTMDVVSHDEIGDFTRSFVEMAHQLRVVTVSRDAMIREVQARKDVELQLKKKESSLKALSSKMMTVLEEERKKIGRDLHDSVVQDLVGLKLHQENAIRALQRSHPGMDLARFEQNLAYINTAIIQLREIIMGLRPAILDDLGLIPALEWYCREFSKTYAQFRLSVDMDTPNVPIPEDVGTAVFRIVQEALKNIVKHSDASCIMVTIKSDDHVLEVRVEDDGQGMDLERDEIELLSMGFSGMRERAEAVHGEFRVHSSPGEGVAICVLFPLDDSHTGQSGGPDESDRSLRLT
ncbi:hypothetical protein DPF_1907 [Desulfoplanes formicivorans]|uniref:histidine kinase n=2 Tax=Desulfoplanes formicivorans TaxID=1592317 RepID=A0A194AGI6_9BACT|nr:hypothetical protein DPF_1907 [Desulfoplanes formicivorans]